MRTGQPWGKFEHLRQNATVLEALAGLLRTGSLDDGGRDDLRRAAAAPCGDYRELALALWKELDPDAVALARKKTGESLEACLAGRYEDAEELAREALSATQGQWAHADRAIATAQFLDGRLGNAAGAARNAVLACPGSVPMLLEYAEILVAGGRIDDALAVLDENNGLLRDSLPDNDLLCDWLRAAALLARADKQGASACADNLLANWVIRGRQPVAWDFAAFEKNLKPDAPGRDRILAMDALLQGKSTPEEFRKAWGI